MPTWGCSSGQEAMEFRQRAPRERLDQDGPLSEERPLPKVPCWTGETECECWAAPDRSRLPWLPGAGEVDSSHSHGPLRGPSQTQARQKHAAFGGPASRMPPRTKTLGPPNSAASGVPDIRLFLATPAPSSESTPNFLFQVLGPQYFIPNAAALNPDPCPQSGFNSALGLSCCS